MLSRKLVTSGLSAVAPIKSSTEPKTNAKTRIRQKKYALLENNSLKRPLENVKNGFCAMSLSSSSYNKRQTSVSCLYQARIHVFSLTSSSMKRAIFANLAGSTRHSIKKQIPACKLFALRLSAKRTAICSTPCSRFVTKTVATSGSIRRHCSVKNLLPVQIWRRLSEILGSSILIPILASKSSKSWSSTSV